MKFISMTVLAVFLMSVSAHATLIDQNDGTILDDVSGQYWYQNLNDFKSMNYSTLTTAINGLTLGDYSWHLASEDDMTTFLENNVGTQNPYGNLIVPDASSIFDNFITTGSMAPYSAGTWFLGVWESIPKSGYHNILEIQKNPVPASDTYVNEDVTDYYFVQTWDTYWDKYGGADTGAWVTTGAIYSPPETGGDPVPEPATMLLFGTGLVGLAAVGRRRRK